MGPLVWRAIIALLDAHKSRNTAFFSPFFLWTGTGVPKSAVSSKGDLFSQELSQTTAAQSLNSLGWCSSVCAHTGERGSFIYFSSFICIRECCHFDQINFFTHHHYQDPSMSSPYICHYRSITPVYRSISVHISPCRSQQLFLSHTPSPPSLLGHTYVNINRKGCSVGKTSLVLRNQILRYTFRGWRVTWITAHFVAWTKCSLVNWVHSVCSWSTSLHFISCEGDLWESTSDRRLPLEVCSLSEIKC